MQATRTSPVDSMLGPAPACSPPAWVWLARRGGVVAGSGFPGPRSETRSAGSGHVSQISDVRAERWQSAALPAIALGNMDNTS
jgi:hypothetical protein